MEERGGRIKAKGRTVRETGNRTWVDFESHMDPTFFKSCAFLLKKPMEAFLKKERLVKIYGEIKGADEGATFVERVLDRLRIRIDVAKEDVRRIPSTGPVVVVSNHPFGALDGLILVHLLASVRPDVKVLANALLSDIPEIKKMLIPVDPFEGPGRIRKNVKPVREAIGALRRGEMVCTFPAGEVAHFQLKKMKIDESRWSPLVARMVRRSRSSVLPVFFNGTNSLLFHLLGLVHSRIRTAMLPGEILKKANMTVRMAIGKPLEFESMAQFSDDASLMAYLQLKIALLKERRGCEKKNPRKCFRFPRGSVQPVAGPVSPSVLLEDIEKLPEESLMLKSRQYRVFWTKSDMIPNVLNEIGRLREMTFRSVGEGTGKALDIDRYDAHYHHLFLWDDKEKALAGAYRMGFSDEILQAHGVGGFYSRSLFDFKPAFIDKIHPAVELGRSFVQQEYQRSYHPLMLLWKGIGHVISRYPVYKRLFGPVSITDDYQAVSRQLIVAFMKANAFDAQMAAGIRGRHIPRAPLLTGRTVKRAVSYLDDLQALSDTISEIERGQVGIPILLKHYMKLGGRILGFNRDPNFNNALDVLILVDLTITDPKILARYMGETSVDAFLRYHREGELEQCA